MSLYHAGQGGNLQFLGTDSAVDGKSSLLVAPLQRLFVARPNRNGKVAALEIYDTSALQR